MKKLIAIILVFFSLYSHAYENEKAEMLAGAIVIIGDWATTRDMSHRYSEGYSERGFLITSIYGTHPKTRQIDLYFIGRLAVHYAMHKSNLSDDNKKIYYYITLADHGYAIANNLSIGLKIKF